MDISADSTWIGRHIKCADEPVANCLIMHLMSDYGSNYCLYAGRDIKKAEQIVVFFDKPVASASVMIWVQTLNLYSYYAMC